jgi:cyclic-di-GMP-binding protein
MGTESFDITSGCDLQEVDNALNQARKEIGQRYDFKGSRVTIEFVRAQPEIVLSAPDEFKLRAAWEVVVGRLTRRGVPLKNVQPGNIVPAAGGAVRQQVSLQQGIPTEAARAVVKRIKELRIRRVQAAIQGDQVRVSSPSRDELQQVIAALKEEDFGIELKFGNYRSQ